MRFALLAALSGLILSTVAFAEDGGVVVNLTAHKVVMRSGKEALESGDYARPGDLLEYRAVYKNTAKAPAKDLYATLPIPSTGMTYVEQSALPRMLQASIDGKRFALVPLTRQVTAKDGRQETQLVPLNEYRFLRWPLGDLAAGASATVSARVRIDDATTAIAAR